MTTREAARVALLDGAEAFRAGDAPRAIRLWGEAARAAQAAGDPRLQAEALARRGEAQRAEGLVLAADADLSAALVLVASGGDARLAAAIAGALGAVRLMRRRSAEAEPLLRRAREEARRLGDRRIAAAAANDLGNLLAADPATAPQAAAFYAEAARDGDPLLAASAEANAARLDLAAGRAARAAERLGSARARLAALPPSVAAGFVLANAGAIGAEAPGAASPALLAARRDALADAEGVAGSSALLASLVAGNQGGLAAEAGDAAAARRLTAAALAKARQVPAPDLSFRWEWQSARLERRAGREEAAIAAYRRAIADLEQVRADIPVEHRDGRSSFRAGYGPLYAEFADLLLARARSGRDAAALRQEARSALEQMKAHELQDFFRDSCVTEFQGRRQPLERLSPDTAVLYPAVLPDRLEWIVSRGTETSQVTVPLPEARLAADCAEFRRLLERRWTYEFLDPARRLHASLIAPLLPVLRDAATLVIVPDGPLRALPFGALEDGRSFLAERHAIALAPGLDLVDHGPFAPPPRRMLVAGLSAARHGFSALPSVRGELRAVAEGMRGRQLLNEAFVVPALARSLRAEDVAVLHIASHGEFGADPSRSFVLAWDGPITMDGLEAAIKPARFRARGLELLVLSACRTATGDDRAALGLAGLAVKAGARSALATLWYVSDEASAALVSLFHRELQRPGATRAGALAAAQRSFIADPLLGHPAYWAPFQMIGNWT